MIRSEIFVFFSVNILSSLQLINPNCRYFYGESPYVCIIIIIIIIIIILLLLLFKIPPINGTLCLCRWLYTVNLGTNKNVYIFEQFCIWPE